MSQPTQPSEQPTTPLSIEQQSEPPSIQIADAHAGPEAILDQPTIADDSLPTLPDVAPPASDDNAALIGEAGRRSAAAPMLADEVADDSALREEQATITDSPALEGGAGGASVKPKRRAAVTAPLSEAQIAEAIQEATATQDPLTELPPLPRETLVVERYAITNVVESHPTGDRLYNLYRVIDEKSYEQCWVCGSKNNAPGELYCSDCGAQLTNKVYTLREQPAIGAEGERGEALLLTKGIGQAQGLPRIYKTFRDGQRDYALIEEPTGQPLASYAPVTPGGERATEDHVLAWTVSLASALTPLHEAGIALGNLGVGSVNIVGGELPRIVDVSTSTVGDSDQIAADVAALARVSGAFLTQPLREGKTPTTNPPTSLPDLLAEAISGRYRTADDLAEALETYRDENQTPTSLSLLVAGGSDVGMARKLNEDSLLVMDFSAVETSHHQLVSLLVVADGMGGHDSGEIASSMAIRTIATQIAEQVLGAAIFNYGSGPDVQPLAPGEVDIMQGNEAVGELLRQAVVAANRRIVQYSRERYSDMGTTCTACLIVGNHAYFANVGDSRAYIYRDGKLEQVTEDHSLAWKLMQAGQLTTDEIRTFSRRNEIYKSLGDDPNTEVDIFSRKLKPYDIVVVCSDGLWEMIYEEDKDGVPGIRRIIEESDDPHDAVQRLIKAANEGGGADNIAVIIAQLLVNGDKEA